MNIQRPDFCTTVGIKEYDWEKNWNDTFVLANKYHKKMHEECPPPYAAVDAGKVHGLLTAIQALQAENAELREAQAELIKRTERAIIEMEKISLKYASDNDIESMKRTLSKTNGMEVVLSYIKEMMKP